MKTLLVIYGIIATIYSVLALLGVLSFIDSAWRVSILIAIAIISSILIIICGSKCTYKKK